MRFKESFKGIIILILCSGELALSANGSGAAGAYLRMPIGARAAALGGACAAVCNDAAALFWNPAGMTQIGRMQVISGYHFMAFERRLTYVAASYPVSKNGTLGLGWAGFGVNGIEARIMNTQHPDFIFNDIENTWMLSYAHRIFSIFAVGVNTKIMTHQISRNSASGYGFDLGLFVRPVNGLTAGISLQDVRTQLRWATGFVETFPHRSRIGAACRISDQVVFSGDISKTRNENAKFHFGTEITLLDELSLRTGLTNNRLSAGFGLNFELFPLLLRIDYSYMSEELNASTIHGVVMIVSFKRLRPDWFIGK